MLNFLDKHKGKLAVVGTATLTGLGTAAIVGTFPVLTPIALGSSLVVAAGTVLTTEALAYTTYKTVSFIASRKRKRIEAQIVHPQPEPVILNANLATHSVEENIVEQNDDEEIIEPPCKRQRLNAQEENTQSAEVESVEEESVEEESDEEVSLKEDSEKIDQSEEDNDPTEEEIIVHDLEEELGYEQNEGFYNYFILVSDELPNEQLYDLWHLEHEALDKMLEVTEEERTAIKIDYAERALKLLNK